MRFFEALKCFVSRPKPPGIPPQYVEMVMFRRAVDFALDIETGGDPNGGYTFDPDDPGGETKWGISKKQYPDLDIKALTREQAIQLYRNDYWLLYGCDKIPAPMSILIFDAAVNMHPLAVKGFIQEARAFQEDVGQVAAFMVARAFHYGDIIRKRPSSIKYRDGWKNRMLKLISEVESLA